MRIARLSLSPLKGGARRHPASVEVTRAGLVGDRRFCLVDPATARVLRTVENPGLLGLGVRVETAGPTETPCIETLCIEVPGEGTVSAPVHPEERLTAEYWGRRPVLRRLPGPWSGAVGGRLGRPVELAEASPGDVVYSGAVTVVTTSSVAEAARRAGVALTSYEALLAEAGRWRANVVLDTSREPPFVEDGWVGRRLRIGEVLLAVRGLVPRCAVVRHLPGTAAPEAADPLTVLAADRTRDGEVLFGLDCDVLDPGGLQVGDTAEVSAGVILGGGAPTG